MRQFKKGKTDEINFAMADASVLGEIPNPKRESGDKGKKSQKKCFIANKEAYERVNYLYQVGDLFFAYPVVIIVSHLLGLASSFISLITPGASWQKCVSKKQFLKGLHV